MLSVVRLTGHRDGRGRSGVSDGAQEAARGALGQRSGGYSRSVVFCLPVAAEKLSKARVVGFARLPLGILEILRKPEAAYLEHAVQGVVRGSNSNEGMG